MSPARLSAPMMARPEGARKIGCYIGRILTPCRTPDPALRPDPNPWYYLKIPKYVQLQTPSEQVRRVQKAHECNDVIR